MLTNKSAFMVKKIFSMLFLSLILNAAETNTTNSLTLNEAI